MKFLILALIIPWFFFPFLYSRLAAFKRSNLALQKALEERETQLRKTKPSREEIARLKKELRESKEALADMQMEFTHYKKQVEQGTDSSANHSIQS